MKYVLCGKVMNNEITLERFKEILKNHNIEGQSADNIIDEVDNKQGQFSTSSYYIVSKETHESRK